MEKSDAVVIGAGIVGLSVAYFLLAEGRQVTILDRDPEGDKASHGNAGGIAVTECIPASAPDLWKKVPGWMMDPLGPLTLRIAHAPRLLPWLVRFAKAGRPAEVERIATALASINSRVHDDLIPMLARTGMSAELSRKGALTVYETLEGFEGDRAEWTMKQRHGVEARELSAEEARDMEPALGPIVKKGVYTPQWSQVEDPRRIVSGLRAWLARQGARIVRADVRNIVAETSGARVELADGGPLVANTLVIAAGAWSGRLATRLGDRALVESERGYNTTFADPGFRLEREVIFAERKFVAAPLSCGLRIGGAAEFGGLDASPNYERSRRLVKLARLYFPDMETGGGTEWSGHRPTTPDSLPVIGPSPRHRNVFYAFGHGHLGLTQAAPTGRLIADAVAGRRSDVDVSPFSIGRFGAS